MSIEKKSLISTLRATKKANVVSTAAPEVSHKLSKRPSKTISKRPSKAISKVISKVVSKRARA